MGRLLIRWIILTISVVIVASIEKQLGLGLRTELDAGGSVPELFVGVAILALLNATLGKIIKFLTLPLSCLTLGVFSLVVNAGILMLVASTQIGFVLKGDAVERFFSAFIGAILISVVNGMLGLFLPDKDDDG